MLGNTALKHMGYASQWPLLPQSLSSHLGDLELELHSHVCAGAWAWMYRSQKGIPDVLLHHSEMGSLTESGVHHFGWTGWPGSVPLCWDSKQVWPCLAIHMGAVTQTQCTCTASTLTQWAIISLAPGVLTSCWGHQQQAGAQLHVFYRTALPLKLLLIRSFSIIPYDYSLLPATVSCAKSYKNISEKPAILTVM